MSKSYPILIFVCGPQEGQRVRLTRLVSILGRAGRADILLSEDYVSREQVRYEMLQAGPTLENLSRRGTWINGKRYRAGRKILVDTGDVIGVGAQTQMLFVSAGDDPAQALSAWEAARTSRRDAFGKRYQPPAVPAPVAEEPPEEEPEPDQAAEAKGEKRASEMTADERAEAERKEKRRKLMTGLGVYWGLLMFLLVLAYLFVDIKPPGEMAEVPILANDEIEQYLGEPVVRSPNPLTKEKKLREAIGLYRQFGMNLRHLHKMVLAFKEAEAYGGKSFLDKPEDDRIYRDCLAELTKIVQRKYLRAYQLEKNSDWAAAEAEFRVLLAIIGDENNPIFVNARKHHRRVKYYLEKEALKKKPLFG
ncbi:hypothetical protein LCGC14_1838670 [marine sediment metagenome]|uniref:FHA domain-containing protein n=1 Tax=marine sediment metagenome TaxID=412755 RepID=A0A0F9H225_9ZZZZ